MDVNVQWVELLESLLTYGEDVSPRGIVTKEILGYQSVIDMNKPMVVVPQRKMNYRFMCGEAFWILSGSNRVSEIAPFMKAISKFSDNGITFNGAYGPKVVDQLQYVIESFVVDGWKTRQAIINIWRENPRPSRDIPCTLSLQFLIRDGALNCMATMRSSDAWLGWVYDTFNFSMISAWIVIQLRKNEIFRNLRLGNLYLTAGSQHLYERDIESAKEVIKSEKSRPAVTPINLDYYTHPDFLLADLKIAGMQEEGWELDVPLFFNQIKDF